MDRLHAPSAPESGRDCFTHALSLLRVRVCALPVILQPWGIEEEDTCGTEWWRAGRCLYSSHSETIQIYWTLRSDLQTFRDPTDVDRCADPDLNPQRVHQPIIKVSESTVSLIGHLCAPAAHCAYLGVSFLLLRIMQNQVCKHRAGQKGVYLWEKAREAPLTPWGYFS